MLEKRPGGFWEIAKTLVYAVLIALGIRTMAYEPFNIPSGSMKPTLLVGDFLFVSKYSYGYSRYSLPLGLPLLSGRVFFTEPERGDVAVFKLPSDNKTDYIKRIIGLPGDEIQVRGGILHINRKPVNRERMADFLDREGGNIRRFPRYLETLPNGRRHPIIEMANDNGPADNTLVFKVPEGHYFGMGDNRDNSQDSRFPHVGFIPRGNLVGRAEVLFFSIDGPAWKLWRWPETVRFERLFDAID
jgi:signal peptidase I